MVTLFIPTPMERRKHVCLLARTGFGKLLFFFDNSKAEPRHLDDIFSGKYRVVYMPEKALHPLVVQKLWANEAFRGRVNLIAVDEAHLVHERTWEHFGTTVPWLLCSATLPRHVKDEVLSSIKIKNPVEVVSDLDRPNCYYLASDAREP